MTTSFELVTASPAGAETTCDTIAITVKTVRCFISTVDLVIGDVYTVTWEDIDIRAYPDAVGGMSSETP